MSRTRKPHDPSPSSDNEQSFEDAKSDTSSTSASFHTPSASISPLIYGKTPFSPSPQSLPSSTLLPDFFLEPPVTLHNASQDGPDETNAGWKNSKYLSVNETLWNKAGLLAIREPRKQRPISKTRHLVTPNTFQFGSATFEYGERSKIEEKFPESKKAFEKAEILVEKLQVLSNGYVPQERCMTAATRADVIEESLRSVFKESYQSSFQPSVNEKSNHGLTQQPFAISKRKQKKLGLNRKSTFAIMGAIKEEEPKPGLSTQLQSTFSKSAPNKKSNILNIIQGYAAETTTTVLYKQSSKTSSFDSIPFLPFIMRTNDVLEHDSSSGKAINLPDYIAIQIYPWISDKNKSELKSFQLSPFKRVAIASCMFGTSIKGSDDIGGKLSIIKHDIKLFPEQIITDIICEEDSFYEEVQSLTLQALSTLMLRTGNQNFEVHCHLPSVDYMMFGVRLFSEGKMTQEALETFCDIVAAKHKELSQRLLEIFPEELGITMVISSPFDNLFDFKKKSPQVTISTFILEQLGIYEQPSLQKKADAASEAELKGLQTTGREQLQTAITERCLWLLINNQHMPALAKIWKLFIETSKKQTKQEINTLEQLLKIGNAVMLGWVSDRMGPREVCSLQPYSEMQIQKAFTKLADASMLSAVFFITHFAEVIAYQTRDVATANKRAGIPFYYDDDANSGARFLTRHGIFGKLMTNTACNMGDSRHSPLKDEDIYLPKRPK